MTPDLAELKRIAEAALRCLYLEAPHSVVNDVSAKVEAVFAAQAARIEALEGAARDVEYESAALVVKAIRSPEDAEGLDGWTSAITQLRNLIGDRHDG